MVEGKMGYCNSYINAATMKAGRDYFDMNHSLLMYMYNHGTTRVESPSSIVMQVPERHSRPSVIPQVRDQLPPVPAATAVVQWPNDSTTSTEIEVINIQTALTCDPNRFLTFS